MELDVKEMGSTSKFSSESDTDSDNGSNWKKKSTRKNSADESETATLGLRRHTGEGPKRPKKGHEMWTENLTNEVLTETFGHCQLRPASSGVYSRGSESYEFKSKLRDDRPEVNMDFDYDYDQNKFEEVEEEFGVLQDKKKANKLKVKERVGDKPFGYSIQKVVDKIVLILKEQKYELIQRCVQFLGAKKCLEILRATRAVENAGGMKTVDGTRRRTPGGVFLQLIRNDPNIRRDSMRKIFEDERKMHHESKKAFRKMKRKQDAVKKVACEMNVDSNEKVLPTRKELFLESCLPTTVPLKQESEKTVTSDTMQSDLEDGEIPE